MSHSRKYAELLKHSANARESIGGAAAGRSKAAPPSKLAPALLGKAHLPGACTIALEYLAVDPDQPRKEFDPEGLERLAESLKTRGQLQPIRVRWDEAASKYVIIMGERRFRAATLAGLDRMACVIHEGPITEDDLRILQLVENCLREDLRPSERAAAFRALMERNRWSQRTLAEKLEVSQSLVAQSLALLETPPVVQDLVDSGQLAADTAMRIARLPDQSEQEELAKRAARERLGRDTIRAEVARRTGKPELSGGHSADPAPAKVSGGHSADPDSAGERINDRLSGGHSDPARTTGKISGVDRAAPRPEFPWTVTPGGRSHPTIHVCRMSGGVEVSVLIPAGKFAPLRSDVLRLALKSSEASGEEG